MSKTIDNRVIPFTKPMDMDLKTSINNMIIPKTLPAQASKFMLKKSMTCHTTQEIFQMFKTTDNKVIPSTKQMVTAPKILQNNMITLKTLPAQVSKSMLNKSMTCLITLEISQMSKITGSKVTLFIKQMDMVLRISQNNMITLKTPQDQANKFMLNKSMIFQ